MNCIPIKMPTMQVRLGSDPEGEYFCNGKIDLSVYSLNASVSCKQQHI